MALETIVDNPQGLTRLLVTRVESAAAAAVAARGQFALAVPGGSVAETFLPPLKAAMIDWQRTHIFWGDERAARPDDPDSNHGLARSLGFLDRVDPAKVHRMPADAPDLEQAARRYTEELTTVLGSPAALDLALLGVGPDGHVCSLFPGHPLLEERAQLVAAILDSPKPPARRLTVTLPVLSAARLLVVAAFGAAKADVIAEALRDPRSQLPVSRALRQSARALVLLDQEAGAALRLPVGARP